MFGFLKRKKVEVWIEREPRYVYDLEIRFRDGRIYSIKEATYIDHVMSKNWIIARDGGETKHINTDQAEEVTITKNRVEEVEDG